LNFVLQCLIYIARASIGKFRDDYHISDNREIIENGGSLFGLIELTRAIFTRVGNVYLGLVRTDLNVEEMSEVYDKRVHYRGSLDKIS
jgi:hypothetical protein